MAEDKRKAVRIKKTLYVQCCLDSEVEKKVWDMATVRDISETGLSISSNKNFSTGGNLLLRIRLPNNPSQPLEMKAKIVDSGESFAGMYLVRLVFLDLSAKKTQILKDYISWFLAREGETKA